MKYIQPPDLEYPDQFDTTHDKLDNLQIINITPTPLLLIHNVEQ